MKDTYTLNKNVIDTGETENSLVPSNLSQRSSPRKKQYLRDFG